MRGVVILVLLCASMVHAAPVAPERAPTMALAEAKRLGKPLLILVASVDPKRAGYTAALGALFNHGPPSLVDAMTRYHVVAMGHIFLRRLGIEGKALAYSIRQRGALVVRAFNAPLPKIHETNDAVMESLAPFASKFEHFLTLIGTPDPDPAVRDRILAGPLPGIVWWMKHRCVDAAKVRPTDRRPTYGCGPVQPTLLAPTESQQGVYCRMPQLLLDWQAR